jgi:Holliday junction resolvase RusA-like endonuclease
MKPLSFRVFGVPRPKGSMRAFCLDSTPKTLVPWMYAIVAASTRLDLDRPLVGAIGIDVVFYMPRPDTRRPYPDGSGGDDDKLERAVKDALQVKAKWGGRVIWDDSQFVRTTVEKQWAGPAEPGCRITITPLEPQPLHLEDYQRIVDERYKPRAPVVKRKPVTTEFKF